MSRAGLFALLAMAAAVVFLPVSVLGEGEGDYCGSLHVPSVPDPDREERPFLGISFGPTVEPVEDTASPCTSRLFVNGVVKGSAAETAGLHEGDVIVGLDGGAVCFEWKESGLSLLERIGERKAGAAVGLDILRGGERLSLEAVLGMRPTHRQREADHPVLGECPEGTSLLGRELLAKGLAGDFRSIREGLRARADNVHNADWFAQGRFNPWQSEEVTYCMRHPLRSAAVAVDVTDRLLQGPEPAKGDPADLLEALAGIAGLAPSPGEAPEEVTFPALVEALERSAEEVRAVLRRIPSQERKLLADAAVAPWQSERWNESLEAALKFDATALWRALRPVAELLSPRILPLLRADLEGRFSGEASGILYRTRTAAGEVIVGGPGPDIYREDAALILDLGGDDLYLNNAGGSRPDAPVALVIDWEGNDRYLADKPFSQGAGLLGGGFLVDLEGNDVYVGLDGSQGVGICGAGLLYDGGGRDDFQGRRLCQGTALMGMGLLLAGEGDSRYACLLEGQGLGFFGGAGALVDRGGSDSYHLGGLKPDFRDPEVSTVSMGQGFGRGLRPEGEHKGVSGGTGILVDAGGDDLYWADYFAQGASYYFGLGILRDLGGDDRYLAGRYAQGAGIHASVGVLLDAAGDDAYHASFGVAQGMGHDYGVGVLRDGDGADRYSGGQLVQGAATNDALGILVDLGGADSYTCASGQAFAEKASGMGILLDGSPDRDTLSRHGKGEKVRIGHKP